jgi:hypothetical protein
VIALRWDALSNADGARTALSRSDDPITPAGLAKRIRVSRSTVDKLLNAGMIPGALRKTPGLKNSPWVIPAWAVDEYRNRHSNRKET